MAAEINVETKILGIFGKDYRSYVIHSEVPAAVTIKKLIKILYQRGEIDKTVFGAVKTLRPPITLLINGEVPQAWRNHKLRDGDSISIFTPVTGG